MTHLGESTKGGYILRMKGLLLKGDGLELILNR
jgi:hypothetical protein